MKDPVKEIDQNHVSIIASKIADGNMREREDQSMQNDQRVANSDNKAQEHQVMNLLIDKAPID